MKRGRILVENRAVEGVVSPEGRFETAQGKSYSMEKVVFLPPVLASKAVGLALNYADHASELNTKPPEEIALFFKPTSSFIGHGAPVVYPDGVEYMHYEVELVVVIGRRCRKVKAERWMEVVDGYTIGNDVTVRDFIQNFYRPPVRAKGYDSFGPVGPFVVSQDEVPHPDELSLRALVNGEVRQQGNTSAMIRKIPELIEYISAIMTLEPGDLIWTGTPKGISHVHPGDMMRMEIEGLGDLQNPVVADEGAARSAERMRKKEDGRS